jgi:anti-sigma B factor antagonist
VDPAGTVTVDRSGDRVVVMGSGELDLATAPELRDALLSAVDNSSSVVVDLSECRFIDSTVLSVLLQARERVLASDGEFTLRGVQGRVMRVLDIAGVVEYFKLAR